MARRHPSTPTQRARWVSQMLAQPGASGLVAHLSAEAQVSRQTLYTWAAQGLTAMERALAPPAFELTDGPTLTHQVLTLLVATHAGYRGVQSSLELLTGQRVSLATIAAIIGEAQRRARAWLASHAPPGARSLALDEMYGNDRRGAYLHIVDTAS